MRVFVSNPEPFLENSFSLSICLLSDTTETGFCVSQQVETKISTLLQEHCTHDINHHFFGTRDLRHALHVPLPETNMSSLKFLDNKKCQNLQNLTKTSHLKEM